MELHSVDSEDIDLNCQEVVARTEGRERRDAQAVVDIIHALRNSTGPEKWLSLRHQTSLSIFAFDPAELRRSERQSPQVVIRCRNRYSEVQYLLPIEQRPWEWATAVGIEIDDTVKLIVNALTRCESRREHLVSRVP